MSVQRQANLLGQQRVDVPHLRALESSIAADFDMLAGRIMAGDRGLVVRGMEMVTIGAIGSPATSLQLVTAGSVIMHPLASEHGTIFGVSSDAPVETLNGTNLKVAGSFAAGQVNYVGLDLRRAADDSTSDLVMFMDANTELETPKSVPLARTLEYRIVISTTDFSSTPNLLPIAKVTTSGVNIVTALEDARSMVYRLGSGGSVPDKYHGFPWVSGRAETLTGAVFSGGDKGISSLKDWMDSVMTRLWEVGGGQYWYSATSDRELKLIMGQPTIPATSDNFQWTLGSQTLQWASLSVTFGNSPVAYNLINDGSAVLTDGQCLYVDIDRTALSTLTAHVSGLTTLGQSAIPGQRFVIAWRRGNDVFIKDHPFEVGRSLLGVANTVVFGVVKLKYAATNPAQPLVLAMQAGGGYVNLADSGNTPAFTGTGFGTGAGFSGIGGASSGPGLRGQGTGGGHGVVGLGQTAGVGVAGQGGNIGSGVSGLGGAGGGFGGIFTSQASGVTALVANAGAGNAIGVLGTGSGNGAGVEGRAVSATGFGVRATGYVPLSGSGGVALIAVGGNDDGLSLGGTGGVGVQASGGDGDSRGGIAGTFRGGDSGDIAGHGLTATGGNGVSSDGYGIVATGGINYATPGVKAVCGANATGAAPTIAIRAHNGNIQLAGVAPNYDADAGSNTLTPSNICKCWGSFLHTGTNATQTVLDGFNVASIVTSTDTTWGIATVTFVTPMANGLYSVTGSSDSSSRFFAVYGKTVNGFNIAFSNGTNFASSAALSNFAINFTVHGRQ